MLHQRTDPRGWHEQGVSRAGRGAGHGAVAACQRIADAVLPHLGVDRMETKT